MSENTKNIDFEITSAEAWEILKKEENTCIIDVRTVAEWSFVGIPDLSLLKRDLHQISWRLYPSMKLNQSFAEQLSYFVPKDTNSRLLFICRSGIRSHEAANYAIELGYKNCHNIIDGFEGRVDKQAHRNSVNGWRHSNLPWVQA